MGKQSANGKRAGKRVSFDRQFNSVAMAADGTWSIQSRVEDISATGARLYVLGQINPRMKAEEFFLLMTPDGKVKRRSKYVWEKKGRVGVQFVSSKSD